MILEEQEAYHFCQKGTLVFVSIKDLFFSIYPPKSPKIPENQKSPCNLITLWVKGSAQGSSVPVLSLFWLLIEISLLYRFWDTLIALKFYNCSKVWFLLVFYFARATSCRISVPWQGIESRPWQWKHQILTTWQPGNSQQDFHKWYDLFSTGVCLWD